MTFDEWAAEEMERMARFRKWWREQNKQDPETYPLDMDPGEWDEQYRIWDEAWE